MELYSIKKGKYHFKGDKVQLAHFQTGFTAIGIILSIALGNLWIFIGSIAFFLTIGGFISDSIELISVRVYFEKSCTYKLSENYDQVNKLFGFSQGFHHWNSARIGWNCTDGENIQLFSYCYVSGKRIIKPMITCKPETWIFCSIQNKSSKYVLKAMSPKVNSITVSIDKDTKLTIYTFFKLFIYRLFPYFGGRISAPHDMKLHITELRIQ